MYTPTMQEVNFPPGVPKLIPAKDPVSANALLFLLLSLKSSLRHCLWL